jgi:hypothetical protein
MNTDEIHRAFPVVTLSDAQISRCGTYRYAPWRRGASGPQLPGAWC